MEYQPKSVKNTHPLTFYIVFKFWRLLLIKIVGYNSHWVFYLFCFILDFTSADIIFHQFLELYLTLSGKKIFVIYFPFLTDSLKPPPPYNGQNLLIVTKFFVDAPSSSVRENPQLG